MSTKTRAPGDPRPQRRAFGVQRRQERRRTLRLAKVRTPARAEELARMNGAIADDDLRSFPRAPARPLALRREANEEGA
jgi:hypothetical protein